jgi:hypothetical protein
MIRGVQLAIVGAAAWSAAASATPVEKRGFLRNISPDNLACVVRVDFTSLAAGPDYETWNTVRAYIAVSKDIHLAEAWTWGREGEFSLCLQIDEASRADTVVADLAAIIPKDPVGKAGPTHVIRPSAGKPPQTTPTTAPDPNR